MRTALLIVALYSTGATPTEAPEHSAQKESGQTGTAPIPLPQIIRAAQDAHRTLRTKLASLDEADVAEEIQAELPTLSAKVEPLAGRSMPLTKQDITDLGPALLRADETLAAWDSQLESAVKHVYA